MDRRVKINDIAQKSGVSVSAVSLVLNHKPGVSEETRSHVMKIASELGYPIKPKLPTDKIKGLSTVGMVVKIDPNILPQANPFYSKVMLGIEEACRRKGINLLFASLPVDENNCPLEIPLLLKNSSVDGLLLVGTCIDESFFPSTNNRRPAIVLVDGYSNDASYDNVVSDNFQAAYQAVEYLIRKGHRHIGLVGGDEKGFPSLTDRRNGYLRAMKENGIPEVVLADFNINQSKGYQQTIDLLNQHPQITAIFCVNDDIGSAALRAARELGRQVPEDLSIIGYDDTYIAANTHPALSTMHVDTLAMGRAAVHLLSLRVEFPESAQMTLTIHPTLVERKSVGIARLNS